MEMTFKSDIRKVDGLVEINFFDNGSGNSVSIKPSSTTNTGITNLQARQIFQNELIIDKKLATFDGGGIPLNGSAHLVGERTLTGWLGNARSNTAGMFTPTQTLCTQCRPRRLPHWELRGARVSKRNTPNAEQEYYEDEFPEDFELIVRFEGDRPPFIHQVKNNNNLVCKWNFERGTAIISGAEIPIPNFNDFNFERGIIGINLTILRWNKPNILPRITYFAGEMHEEFDGNALRSMDILEEKTGTVNELSYGISANSCKVSILNRNRMFYKPDNFKLLRRGRRVSPQVKCGEVEYPLGIFFSEEWQLDDASPFMTCTAHDILYSLQNLEINFGQRLNPREGVLVEPYRNMFIARQPDWVEDDAPRENIIDRVFQLINFNRQDNGIFEPIEHEIRLSTATCNIQIPYVLIDKKSAWEVLADIANLCCAYVYCDREGKVIIEEDNFEALSTQERSALKDNPDTVQINPDNAFKFSLPVKSRTIVNKVNCTYNYLKDARDESDEYEININDCERVGDRYRTTIQLNKVYERILNINILDSEENVVGSANVINVTARSVIVEFESDFNTVWIVINHDLFEKSPCNYTEEKEAFLDQCTESIRINGLKPYSANISLYASIQEEPVIVQRIAEKILSKYQNGVAFVDTEWKGDAGLHLKDKFVGQSLFEEDGIVYECLSSEISLSNGFRQTTKGRGVSET